MKIQVRAFTIEGIGLFRTFLESAREGDPSPFPMDSLISENISEIILPGLELEQKVFHTKAEMVNYLYTNIATIRDIPFNNKGLWTWLAALYFESICPLRNGQRKVQEDAKYILNVEHWGRYYRHLIAAPIRLCHELKGQVKIYLAGTPDKHGDLLEQLASRQEIATNPGIIEAATALYWDEEGNRIKRGVLKKEGFGILRRFTRDIIPQFQMTYDLNSMTGQEIIALLPQEFNIWKNNSSDDN
jgi:hypothetical protein